MHRPRPLLFLLPFMILMAVCRYFYPPKPAIDIDSGNGMLAIPEGSKTKEPKRMRNPFADPTQDKDAYGEV